MKNLIVAISGVYNCGKSSTLRLVRNELLTTFGGQVQEGFKGSGKSDFRLVIRAGDITIGIESKGDPGSPLSKSLAKFVSVDCQIIICACRSYGKTRRSVETYSDSHDLVFISKTRSTSQEKEEADNRKCADHVLKLVSTRLEQLAQNAA